LNKKITLDQKLNLSAEEEGERKKLEGITEYDLSSIGCQQVFNYIKNKDIDDSIEINNDIIIICLSLLTQHRDDILHIKEDFFKVLEDKINEVLETENHEFKNFKDTLEELRIQNLNRVKQDEITRKILESLTVENVKKFKESIPEEERKQKKFQKKLENNQKKFDNLTNFKFDEEGILESVSLVM